MNSARRSIPVITALAVILAVPLFGQTGMTQGMGQRMGHGKHMHMYDPSTVETVSGTVEEAQESTARSGQAGQMNRMDHVGTHLILKTDSGTYAVLVGPSSFVKDKGFEFSKVIKSN